MFAYATKQNQNTNANKSVQKKSVSPYESRSSNSNRSNSTGIPTQMKEGFERSSGLSFDDVRVHYNSDKPAQLQALAYTQGNDVHVAPGQEKHLGHELGHVVQQKQGRVNPTVQMSGANINDDAALESEADDMANTVQCMDFDEDEMLDEEDEG